MESAEASREAARREAARRMAKRAKAKKEKELKGMESGFGDMSLGASTPTSSSAADYRRMHCPIKPATPSPPKRLKPKRKGAAAPSASPIKVETSGGNSARGPNNVYPHGHNVQNDLVKWAEANQSIPPAVLW